MEYSIQKCLGCGATNGTQHTSYFYTEVPWLCTPCKEAVVWARKRANDELKYKEKLCKLIDECVGPPKPKRNLGWLDTTLGSAMPAVAKAVDYKHCCYCGHEWEQQYIPSGSPSPACPKCKRIAVY